MFNLLTTLAITKLRLVQAEAELAKANADGEEAATLIIELVRENEKLKRAPAPTANPNWAEESNLR